MGGLSGLLKIFAIALNLAYLNFLWIIFSLLGLVVFGFFPATSAMFGVIRKWFLEDWDLPIFKTFWNLYKKEFIKSNILGYILFLAGFILYLDIKLVQQMSNIYMTMVHYFLLMLTFVYVLTIFYVWPVFVHFELSVLQVIKTAFSFMVISPYSTIMMAAGGVIFYFTVQQFPGLLLIFGGSVSTLLIMWSTHIAFRRRDQKIRQNGKEATPK
ncbi:YesL family protein [Bacillus sp. USDA818B3_A]|uniref:YesL family protein n=1 Tax=Bacillus sp. USDA818B3_A TaxID=2698834 RepID=UPI0013681AD0|nr:YesL family protein [Bacillus sp. USDA818B3_A]